MQEITIPKLEEKLNEEQLKLLKATAKACRKTIIEMLKQSQSGHPGGSLSSLDYLVLLYTFIISQTGEKIIISHGHISPAVYSILAELNYINKEKLIKTFRQVNSIFEGHITRHVKGIYFGTGPLGVGTSIGTAFAHAEKLKQQNKKVFLMMGDGEAQEGQFYEAINYANKYNLNNLILFIDYNKVQLTDSLEKIMPLNLKKILESANWNVLETDGHNYEEIWETLNNAYKSEKPVAIIGHTTMGKGVDFMEETGKNLNPAWHGKAPKEDQCNEAIKKLQPTEEDIKYTEQLRELIKWTPEIPEFIEPLTKLNIKTGIPRLYTKDELTDSRTAYGKALLDLAKENQNIIAISADLRGSVMTKFVAQELPNQHLEVGIAEQQMMSLAGGLSLNGFIPFASTFGAFLTSRAKDQARVNDINQTNVKMVATHCGLSVGEDGPTHQAIDDLNTFLGMYNTMLIEPADPNQCDRIIRYIASHYGNFYVRMGRHKYPIITDENGQPFFNTDYKYTYGKTDTIRKGNKITIVATGAMVYNALTAVDELKQKENLDIELISATSIKKFDTNLENSIRKTQKIITIEDHNTISGLSSQLAKYILEKNIEIKLFKSLGVKKYQLSGKAQDLYEKEGLSKEKIINFIKENL